MPTDPITERSTPDALSDPDRLDALVATALPDSAPEAAFDRLTRLVQRCLRVPVALVTVVDEDRQFFKSQQGLGEPWCSLRETPLSHSFCQHVVRRDAPLVVRDAREDPLVHDNGAIRDLGVVAYLGVPLRTPDGHTIGSICAIDSVPRAWTDGDRETLEAIAETAMEEIAERYRYRTTADALDRAEALFGTLFDGISQLTGLLAPGGTVVEANRAALSFVGLGRGDIVGRPLWDSLPLPEEMEARHRDALRRAAVGETVRYEETAWDRQGREHVLDVSLKQAPGMSGLLLLEGRVVTEAVRLRRVQSAMMAGLAGTWEFDPQTGLIIAHGGFNVLFGLPPDAGPFLAETYLERIHPDDVDRVRADVEASVEVGDEHATTYRIPQPDGSVRWVRSRGIVADDPDSSRSGRMVGALVDVTHQYEEAAAATRATEQLQLALDAAELGTWDFTPSDGVVRWDRRGRSLFGMEEDSVPLETIMARIHPDDAPGVAEAIEDATAPGSDGAYDIEYRVDPGDGTVRWIRAKGKALFDQEDEGTVRFIGVLQDVTERREGEQSLRRSRRRLQLALLAARLGTFEYDPQADTHAADPRACELLGLGPDVTAQTFIERVHAEDRADVERYMARAADGTSWPIHHEYRLVRPDGSFRWIASTAWGRPGRDGAVRVIGTVRDVTARRANEEALRESEERYRTLFESVDVGFCIVEILYDEAGAAIDYRFVETNPAFVAQTGLEDAVGRTAYDLVPDLEPHWVEAYADVAASGEPLRFTNGSEAMGRWFDVYATRVGGAGSRRIALLFTDVSEQKAAEQALRKSEARFRRMADTAPALLWVTDLDGACTFLSQGWYDYTGQTEEEALGLGWVEAVHPDDREAAADAFLAANARQEPFRLDYRLRHRDGTYRWAIDAGQPRFGDDDAFAGFVGSVIDIHERKRAEARTQLLAETGRLAEQALDYEATLTEIAHLAVPGFADWCAVDLLGDDGSISAVAIAHADPEKVRWAWDLREKDRALPDAPTGVPHVIRTGEAEFYPDIPDDLLVEAARDEEHLRLMREIGFSSVIIAPMRTEGAVIGAITFVQTESGRNFDEGDVEVAMEIGRRAGGAIETARLHRAVRAREARYRALTEATTSIIWTTYAEGAFTEPQPQWEAYTGQPWAAHCGFGWADALHPDDRADVRDRWQEARDARARYAADGRLWHAESGTYRHFIVRAVPLLDDRGDVREWIGMVTDVEDLYATQEALREREAEFATLADNIPQLAWMTDETGSIFWYNQRWYDYTGTTFETQQGWGWQAVHHPDHVERVTARFKAHIEAGKPWEDTFPLRRADGAFRWFLSRAEPIRDDEGRIVRWFGTNTDVTRQRELEASLRESQARFRQLAEALPDIVYTNDAEGRVDYLNHRWFEYTGQPEDTDPATAAEGVFHPNDTERVGAAWNEALAEGRLFEAALRLRRADGAFRWFLTRVLPVHDAEGRVARWFGTSTDIHAQKAAEAELAERVAERTKELARSNEELDQFAYVASHDLKAPLRAIDNLATWIEEDAADTLPKESARHLALLRSRASRMEGLLDGLLAYSRVGRKEAAPEPVDTAALVRDVVALVAPPEGFTVEVAGELPTVVTARAPLELVFRNLISNAIKHHDRPDGRVTISASAQGEWAEFAVADDGPGIPPEYQDRVFGLFQTLRPRDEVEGSGMGLAIVEKTVESRGGRITLDTGSGRGTTFRFTWPLHSRL